MISVAIRQKYVVVISTIYYIKYSCYSFLMYKIQYTTICGLWRKIIQYDMKQKVKFIIVLIK